MLGIEHPAQSFDFFLPVTLGTSSPESKKSGYDNLPLDAPPADMRQFAPSTGNVLVTNETLWSSCELTNKGLAGYVATGVREQVHSGIGNITNVAQPTKRLALDVGLQSIRWQEALKALDIRSVQFRIDELIYSPLSVQ